MIKEKVNDNPNLLGVGVAQVFKEVSHLGSIIHILVRNRSNTIPTAFHKKDSLQDERLTKSVVRIVLGIIIPCTDDFIMSGGNLLLGTKLR